jgi:hypothetical protein
MLPFDMLEHEVGAKQDRVELVGLARATLVIVQEDLSTEIFIEFAAGLLDARTFLSSHFQGVLAPVGELLTTA